VIPIKDNIPTDRFPVVTVALIVLNVIVYLLAIRHGGSFFSGPDTHEILKYGAIPRALTHGAVHIRTVFSAMFIHASLLHLAGNMLFLWLFGNNTEDSMGRVRYLLFYLVGGVAALALQVAVAPNSTAPIVGASGAIAAVLGGYIRLFPRARVLTFVVMIFFFTVIELPALVMLGLWVAMQTAFNAFELTTPTGGGGIGPYLACLGGFVFGYAAIGLLAANRKDVPPRLPVY
jgi:membrane associated rhomboid family serine protease